MELIASGYSLAIGMWLVTRGTMNASVFVKLVELARPADANVLWGWAWLLCGTAAIAATFLRVRWARIGSHVALAFIWSLAAAEVLFVKSTAFIPIFFICIALTSVLAMLMVIVQEAPKPAGRSSDASQ